MEPITRVEAGQLDALTAEDGPLLIEFGADWCGPCRHLEPVLADIAADLGDRLRVVRVDADEAPDAVDRYGAGGLPSLVMVRNGQITGRLTGWHEPSDLRREITLLLDVASGVALPGPAKTADRDPAEVPDEAGRTTTEPAADGAAARTLRFPDTSVGVLRITHDGTATRTPAAGRIDVPASADVGLRIGDGVTGLEFLRDLPPDGIDMLHLDGPFSDDDLAGLAGLRGLRSVLIASDRLAGSGLGQLAGAQRLDGLMLRCPQLDDDGTAQLPPLPSLRLLAIHGAQRLGDAGIAAIGGCVGLTSLDLCAHRVSDAGLRRLLAGLRLTGLTLCIPDITDAGLSELAAHQPDLRSLALETPLIGPEAIRQAGRLTRLGSLALYNCRRLVPADLTPLSGLATLRIENDDRMPGEADVLRLRLALPDCEINGSWFAADAVRRRLAELTGPTG